ncbi:MAG: outer rane biosis protein BamB [Planctomycetaceae bacterium]|nr:outer rane biosis protein BamB [Planctomycetaceae bacterium]
MFCYGPLVRSSVALGAFFIPLVCLTASWANDWPTFRGSDRTAVSKETGLLQEWPAGGPARLWEAKGAGRGYSSLAIAGGRIYTLGDGGNSPEDKDEALRCFKDENGELLWKTKTGPAWDKGQANWQSSRGTPTVDGELVYVVTPHGQLVCCEIATGSERWRKDLVNDFEGEKGDIWGYSESVLIDGDQLICTPGGEMTTLAALNKVTGELKWKTVRDGDRGAGHASAVISEVGGTRVYVQSTASGPMGVRASDGTLLWKYDVERTTCVIPTPVVRDDLVFWVAGYKRGGALLKQVPGPDNTVKIEEIYPVKTELANKHGGVVLVGDYLFGDSDDKGIPYCAELLTGAIKWQKRGSGSNSASYAAADGRLYIHFANGVMVLAKASPEDYVEVGSFKVPGSGERPSWSHPVIANGKMYLREQDVINCYDIKAK